MVNNIIENFIEKYAVNKADVLYSLEQYKLSIDTYIRIQAVHTNAYFNVLYNIINNMYIELDKKNLIEDPTHLWNYSFEIDYTGLSLYLIHNNVLNNKVFYPDDKVLFHKYSSRLLLSDEYAKLFHIDTQLVRQWIRRGKIRTAHKEGNIWKIPELTEIPTLKRGYQPAVYKWPLNFNFNDQAYDFLNGYSTVVIKQNENDPYSYIIDYSNEETKKNKIETLKTAEKEKLELLLIANPNITYEERYNDFNDIPLPDFLMYKAKQYVNK